MNIEQFNSNVIYKPKDFKDILRKLPKYEEEGTQNNKATYLKVPCGFDIETSSFYEGNEKRGIMYEWTFGIDGYIIIGRRWTEFVDCMKQLSEFFRLNGRKRILVGVHNLAFEFQFMRKWFKWDKVFSVDKRKPVYALTDGIEFRCTLCLTGLKLEKVAEDMLSKWNIKKLVGELDYTKVRHSDTPLTKKELNYCVNDVKIVMALMEEKSRQDGGYAKIPITKTSYVRNRCRDRCFGLHDDKEKYKCSKYRAAIQTLKLTPEDYIDLKRAFMGGFTHCNYWWSGDTGRRVSSYDFTSSYPTVMITEKFPVTGAFKWSEKNLALLKDDEFLHKTLDKYCCLFRVRFEGLREKFKYEHYLSRSRCVTEGKVKVDNGRIIHAEALETTITEQDFYIIEKCYEWDKMEIPMFKTFVKGYLPKDFVMTIVDLYKKKTELKGVEGKEEEYMSSKADLNSLYGMCVMDIVRDLNEYDDDWQPEPVKDMETLITKYNLNKWRFLFYPWGIWVCAYARYNLWTGIFEFGEDYIYSDTDSLKVVNAVNHLEYFNSYNVRLNGRIEEACKYHGIPPEDLRPKTVEGVEKPIGVWDYEGTYSRFKSLGAKRYIYTSLNKKTWKDELHLTVSGLTKTKTMPYLLKKYNNNMDKIFDSFCEGMYIPPDKTGKLTHTYLDDEMRGEVIDYRGKQGEYYEKTAIHLEGAEYSLSLADDYAELLKEILKVKIREG